MVHVLAIYAIIGVTIVAYALDRFSIEMVAVGSLSAFLILFSLFPLTLADGTTFRIDELLAGFANPALVTVLALLIIGQALFATDALDWPVKKLSKLAQRRIGLAIGLVLVSSAVLSSVINNTPVVMIFMPIITALAAQQGLSPSRVLMPLSFMALLGGATTLIGSSTNLLVAGIADGNGINLGFFSITVPGVVLLAVGSLYVFTIMPRLLKADVGDEDSARIPSGQLYIGEIRITADHPFAGLSSMAGTFPKIGDFVPMLVVRDGQTHVPPFEDITLGQGDRLVVSGTRAAFTRGVATGTAGRMMSLRPQASDESANSDANDQTDLSHKMPGPDYEVALAVIAPGSRHAGRTVQNAGVEAIHGVDLIGVQRKARMMRSAMAEIRLESGDTLMIGGSRAQMESLRERHDLILIEWSATPVPQTRKAGVAIGIFAAVVLLAALDIVPIPAAATIGAFLTVATGCLTLHRAALAFDRQLFLVVGSSIAAGVAMQVSGAAVLLAQGMIALLEGQSTAILLSAIFFITAILTNLISNNATAVMLTPIALGVSAGLNVHGEAFAAAVIFGANASFATPIGYQTNLMVMGPGRYSFNTFVKAGLPLTLLVWLTFSLFAPWYYGL